VTDLVPGGTKPAGDGRWGQSDLAGNVHEWTLDWHTNYADTCINCADLTVALSRVLRGGSFDYDAADLRAGTRNFASPTYSRGDVGVRCARTP